MGLREGGATLRGCWLPGYSILLCLFPQLQHISTHLHSNLLSETANHIEQTTNQTMADYDQCKVCLIMESCSQYPSPSYPPPLSPTPPSSLLLHLPRVPPSLPLSLPLPPSLYPSLSLPPSPSLPLSLPLPPSLYPSLSLPPSPSLPPSLLPWQTSLEKLHARLVQIEGERDRELQLTKQRERVLEELLSTEQAFVADLRLIVEVCKQIEPSVRLTH